MKRVLVLGGTGFVGRAVCELLARQHPAVRVCVPTRRPAHGHTVRALPNVDLHTANVHEDTALASVLQGCDAVVNLVAILHGSPAAFEQVHVELPRRLAAACKARACSSWCTSAPWAWASRRRRTTCAARRAAKPCCKPPGCRSRCCGRRSSSVRTTGS